MSQLVEPENVKEFYPNAPLAICTDSYFDKDSMTDYFHCKGDALEGLTIQNIVLTHEFDEFKQSLELSSPISVAEHTQLAWLVVMCFIAGSTVAFIKRAL